MRTVYREHMNNFAHDLIIMEDHVRSMMSMACTGLLNASVKEADKVMASIERVEELHSRCEERAIALLALESPVAGELRQIVSGAHIVENLSRMGALAVHVAKATKRRYPDHAVPDDIAPFFSELATLTAGIGEKLHNVLVDRDVEAAMELGVDDDAIDDIHAHLFQRTTEREWNHSVKAAVDVTLLSRYFERYSDHAVNIGTRVVYMATGLSPEEYADQKMSRSDADEVRSRFDEIRRRYDDSY